MADGDVCRLGADEGGVGMAADGMTLADQQDEKKARKRGRKKAPSDG